MTTAQAIRNNVEAALAGRISSPFTHKTVGRPECFPTRIPSIDLLLDGGIPRGSLTEITGCSSSGRTGLAMATVASATSRGAACAWVDVQDSFDPESAAAWGVDLQRLLWLRAGEEARCDVQAKPCVLTKAQPEPQLASACAGMHPRNETRNMDRAVALLFNEQRSVNEQRTASPRQKGLLRDKTVGTPGAANRSFSQVSFYPRCAESQSHHRRVEQIATDRLPSRRGDVILNKPPITGSFPTSNRHQWRNYKKSTFVKPWSRLDQALRATDLLLQAGGFGAIVLDMCDYRPEDILRIPLATWYRFRLAAEQAQSSLILLTKVPCAKSCAAFSLRCELAKNMAEQVSWADKNETTLFTGLDYRVYVDHKRRDDTSTFFHKKPASTAYAIWSSCAVGAR